MKICVRCRKIFNEDLRYCTVDGQTLIECERLEKETGRLLRKETNELPPIPVSFQFAVPQPASKLCEKPKQSSINFFVALTAIIFFLSGSLVLTTISSAGTTKTANENSDINVEKTSGCSLPEIERKNEAGEISPELKPVESPTPTDVGKTSDPQIKNVSKQGIKEYNARIIMLNAVIRSAPTMEAEEKEIVNLDERIKIGKQAGPNSPWYQVVTASGVQGWIHGNMFEFVKQN